MRQFTIWLLAAAAALSLAACRNPEKETQVTEELPSENRDAAESTAEPETEMPGEEEIDINAAETQDEHILIAYFSLGRNAEYPEAMDASTSASLVLDGEELAGTTEYVAELIRDSVGGDLYSIQTADPYPADFDAVVDQNHEVQDE